MQARFSFNSKAAQETYAEAWDKRDPWRMLKKNVSFAAPPKQTKVCGAAPYILCVRVLSSLFYAHPSTPPLFSLPANACCSLILFLPAAAAASVFGNIRFHQEPGVDMGAAAVEVRAPDAKAVVVVDPFSSGALLAKRWGWW